MKISTKGRYALRIMLDLAANDDGGYTSVKVISQRQGISGKYLEQIITLLSKAGFVKSTRGSNGGYRLSRNAGEYTVGDILRITEGSMAPVNCLEGENNDCCYKDNCVTLGLWERVYDAVNGVLDGVTLAELADDQKNIECDNA